MIVATTLKQDTEWLPASTRHWTPSRYWRKVNRIGQTILSCQEEGVPDLVALVEVENDSVIFDLTRKSLLRNAGYHYLMTDSPDERGIDVALLYQPFMFRPLCCDYLSVTPVEGMRPTRDILYVQGEYISGDTLHVFVVHAPSRYGGERVTRPNRQVVADKLVQTIRLLPPDAKVIVVGDFNDGADDPALRFLESHSLRNITRDATGSHGAKATYRYQGEWGVSTMSLSVACCLTVSSGYISMTPPSCWKRIKNTEESNPSVLIMGCATSKDSVTICPW